MVVDHHTGYYHGDTGVSKASPLNWLRTYIETHSPSYAGKYLFLDQGGELYSNPAIRRLFDKYKYTVRPTGADSSNQNGPVERAHLNVANAIRAANKT
jgi:hypothetical protein